MSNIIGKLIGYLFVIMIIFAPLFSTIYFGKFVYYAFVNSNYEKGKISDCYAIESRSGSNIKRSWAPMAKTEKNDIAKGNFGWKKKASCEEDIGKEVGIFVSKIDSNRNQIHTFFQLWFQFLLSLVINIILYLAIINGYRKKRQKA